MYGDDDLIKRPFKQPIYKEINKRLILDLYENQAKSIVKGNLKEIKFKSVHYPHLNDSVPSQQYLSDGNQTSESQIEIISDNKEPAYINHYITKAKCIQKCIMPSIFPQIFICI